jgi:broad specificity phosphatase PhoE
VRKLVLIKHARPEVVAGQPANQWRLGERGKLLAEQLAQRLTPYALSQLVSSEEPKATETAEILARVLSIPTATAPGLQEHDRGNEPLVEPRIFQSAVALFFKKPAQLVLGRETAEEVQERFEEAVQSVLRTHTEGNIGIVSHGTVISLFLHQHAKLNPYLTWKQLALPSFVVLSLPQLNVLERVDQIT